MTEHSDEPTTESTVPAPPPPAVPAPQPYPAPGYPGYAAPYAFAPVPKQPWFNPAKRTSILVSAIVAAIVLLGGGVVIGAVATHHHDRRDSGFSFVGPGGGARIGPNGGGRPRGPRFNQNNNGPGQLPSPSTSSTTS